MLETSVRDPDNRPLDANSDAEATRLSPIQVGQGLQWPASSEHEALGGSTFAEVHAQTEHHAPSSVPCSVVTVSTDYL